MVLPLWPKNPIKPANIWLLCAMWRPNGDLLPGQLTLQQSQVFIASSLSVDMLISEPLLVGCYNVQSASGWWTAALLTLFLAHFWHSAWCDLWHRMWRVRWKNKRATVSNKCKSSQPLCKPAKRLTCKSNISLLVSFLCHCCQTPRHVFLRTLSMTKHNLQTEI